MAHDMGDSRLGERVTCGLFYETRQRILVQLDRHRGRWDDECHFIRSAVNNFLDRVEREEVRR